MPRGNLTKDNSSLSLWAPFAAKFVEPVELSNKVVSCSGVTSVSETLNPTTKDGLTSYGSRISAYSLF